MDERLLHAKGTTTALLVLAYQALADPIPKLHALATTLVNSPAEHLSRADAAA